MQAIDHRSEAERVIEALARDAKPIPPDWMVRAIMDATPGATFPLHRAALDAVLRRLAYARRDELKVAQRPPGGQPYGVYRTRPKGAGLRPWETELFSVAPLIAECDCPDFLRGGLGICKHVLVVLEDLAGRKRARTRALRSELERPPLRWDPRVPLEWRADPLTRLSLDAERPLPKFAGRWRRDGNLRRAPDVTGERRHQLLAAMERWATEEHAGPATRRVIRELAAEARRARDATAVRKRAWNRLGELELDLYRYQKDGVRRFLDTGRLLLADDMGLGKTIQATAACHLLHRSGAVRRGLVVVPASLKAQWKREWQSVCSSPITLVEGDPATRRAIYDATDRGFLLVGYAQLRRDAKALLEWAPQMMVLDEAQRIKNWQTKTAQTVKRFAPRYRLVLTGTPLENRIEELASIMDWVDDWALAPKWRLPVAHVSEGGATGLATLRARLAPSLLRRRRAEILDQLPERSDRRLLFEMTGSQREAHDDLARPIAKLVRQSKRRKLTPAEFLRLMSLLNRQRMIANGMAQISFEELWPALQGLRPTPARLATLQSPKLDELRELIRSLVIDQGRKVVVFSQWRRMLRLAEWALSDVLADSGHRAVFFTGQESTRQRTRNVVDFHDDPKVAVLFASDAGGVGLNLQRAASCCIQLEQPWNPAVFEQRVARIHRLGQTEPVDVITLSSAGSIEERIGHLSNAKRALFEGLFDGDADQVAFHESSSFCANLEKVIPASDLEPAWDLADADPDEVDGGDLDGGELDGGELDGGNPDGGNPDGGNPDGDTIVDATDHEPLAPPPVASIPQLFGGVRVTRTAAGGLRIEAEPESAATLATLFEGMAQLMRQAHPPAE